MKRLLYIAITAACLSFGCASNPDVQKLSATERAAAASAALSDPDRWDDPERGDNLALTSPTQAAEHLGFTPLIPTLSSPVWRMIVSTAEDPPYRNFYLVFHFPPSASFPVDGRVQIIERAPGVITQDELRAMATGVPNSSLIDVAGHEAVLNVGPTNSGLEMIVEGVVVEVTGPALTANAAKDIATAFARSATAPTTG